MIKTVTMISIAVIILAGFAYFTNVFIGSASAEEGTEAVGYSEEFGRYVENVAFGVGEKLEFDVGYGFINAGHAVMEVRELIEYEGRPCFKVVSTAYSNKFFSSFYKVEDQVTSVIDAIGVFSWYFEKNLREGNYRSDRSYSFNQKEHHVVYEGDTLEISRYTQDALSILYYTRTQDMKPGESIFIDNFTDGENYPLEVRVLRKETIKVKAGKFDCVVVEPLLQTAGIFKHEGKLTVWLTDDRVKMPVLMKSKVLVGSISAELTGYTLGEIHQFE